MAIPVPMETLNLAMTMAIIAWFVCFPLDVVQRILFKLQDKKENKK